MEVESVLTLIVLMNIEGNDLYQREVICQVLEVVIYSIKSSVQDHLYHNDNDFKNIYIEFNI